MVPDALTVCLWISLITVAAQLSFKEQLIIPDSTFRTPQERFSKRYGRIKHFKYQWFHHYPQFVSFSHFYFIYYTYYNHKKPILKKLSGQKSRIFLSLLLKLDDKQIPQQEIDNRTNVDPTLDTKFRLSESECRRTVEMITMYCVGTTPVSNVLPMLVTNIFSTHRPTNFWTRNKTLLKDFHALNPNLDSEFTLYVRLPIYPNLKVRKTRLFALFGVMWHSELIFFRKTGQTIWKYQSCSSETFLYFSDIIFFHGVIVQWSLLKDFPIGVIWFWMSLSGSFELKFLTSAVSCDQ